MSMSQINNFLFLLLVLFILYTIINNTQLLKESFESDDSKKSGKRECSEAAINNSILDYIFTPFHFVR
jgi:hypothetical protein